MNAFLFELFLLPLGLLGFEGFEVAQEVGLELEDLSMALFWIWRTRSFVTPMIWPTCSRVMGLSSSPDSRPKRCSMTVRSTSERSARFSMTMRLTSSAASFSNEERLVS